MNKNFVAVMTVMIAAVGCGGRNNDTPYAPPQTKLLAQVTQVSDTVTIQGYRANYTITKNADDSVTLINLIDQTSQSFPPTLKTIKFADKFVSFDSAGIPGQSYRLYQAAFNRQPDLGGLGFWTHILQGGMSLDAVADNFYSSPEFQALYGQVSDDQFITLLYNNVLRRVPDQGGHDFWSSQIKSGMSRQGVLVYFSESPENVGNVAAAIENGIDYIPDVADMKVIPVQKSSYLNAKNLNIPSQKIPTFTGVSGATGYREGATGGIAFGDFLQSGQISLVVFTNRWRNEATTPNPVGAVHFYKYVDGEPIDVTSSLLKDTTGCVAPRRVLVADFNNDGKPDVFASCHGSEFGPYASWPGEAPRILLSQLDGTYINTPAPITCYCHGASAGDVDGDGNIDIVASDANRSRDGKSSYILLHGDGKGKFTEVTGFIAAAADYAMFDKAYYKFAFNVELIDINGDGKLDVFLGGGDLSISSYILLGDGRGKFMSIHSTFAVGAKDYHLNDALFANGYLYIYTNLNSDQYKNQVRKYDLATGNYTVIYDGAVVHPNWDVFKYDFVSLMIYKGTLVPYDSRFNETVAM